MKFVQFNASVRKYRKVDLQLRDNGLNTYRVWDVNYFDVQYKLLKILL